MALSLVMHLLGMVIWVGGLMAMSRVMVLHAKEPAGGGPAAAVLSRLEGRFNVFALLGAVLTALTGLYQLSEWQPGQFRHARWMHHKLTAVLLLVAVHAVLYSVHRKWQRLGPEAKLSRGQAAGLHGAVGILLIAILSLVIFGRLGLM